MLHHHHHTESNTTLTNASLPTPLQHKLNIIHCLSTTQNRFLTKLTLYPVWRDSGNWDSLHLNITQQVLIVTTAGIRNTWILLCSTAGHVNGVFPHDTFPYLVHMNSDISRYPDKGHCSVRLVPATTHFLSSGFTQYRSPLSRVTVATPYDTCVMTEWMVFGFEPFRTRCT